MRTRRGNEHGYEEKMEIGMVVRLMVAAAVGNLKVKRGGV